MLEKGRNHLLSLDAPHEPLGHLSNDEIKFISPPPARAPIPWSSPAPTGAARTTATTWWWATSTRCPPRSAAAATTPTPSSPACARTTSACCPTFGPVERRDGGRLALRLRGPGALLRRGRADRGGGRRGDQPVRGLALGPVPDAAGARTCTGPCCRCRPPSGPGCTPTGRRPASTRCPTTAGRPATTAGSAAGSAARSTPRATRWRCCAAPCDRPAARSDPSRGSTGSRSTPSGARPPACATWTPIGSSTEVRADHVVLAAGAFETPRLMLGQSGAPEAGWATRRAWWDATSCSTSRP